MSISIGLVIAFLAFLTISGITAKSIFKGSAVNYKLMLSVAAVAIVAQLMTVRGLLFLDGASQVQFSLAAMSLLVNVLICTVLTLRSVKHANLMLLLVTYLFSGLLSLGLLLVPANSSVFLGSETHSSLFLFIHIILSFIVFGKGTFTKISSIPFCSQSLIILSKLTQRAA